MIDDFEGSSPYYADYIHSNSEQTSGDLVDQILSDRHRELQEQEVLDYYQDFTDYEHKEIKEENARLQESYLETFDEGLNRLAPKTEEKKPAKKEEKFDPKDRPAAITPDDFLLRGVQKVAESDVVESVGLGTAGQAVSAWIDARQDIMTGMRKSIVKTMAALPRLLQSGLDYGGAPSEVLEDFNKDAANFVESTFQSSGRFKTEGGTDIPFLAGEIAGYFAVPGGVAGAVLKATKGAGVITKGASLLASEGMLGALLTDKDTGTLLNLFYEQNEADKVPMMLRLLHVDEDDSEFEARLKGALEGIIPVSLVGVAKGLKSAKNSLRGIRDSAVIKQINRKPDLSRDYVLSTQKTKFDEEDFKGFVFKDYLKDEIDDQYNNFSKYLADERGSFDPFGWLIEREKVMDSATDTLAAKLEAKKKALSQKKFPKQAKKLNDEIKSLTKELDDVNNFRDEVLLAVKDKDYKKVSKTFGDMTKKPHVAKAFKKELSDTFSAFEDQAKYFDNMQKFDPVLFNSLRGVFHNLNLNEAPVESITNSNFLTLLAKPDASMEDAIAIVKNKNLAFKEVDEINKKFFNFDVKKTPFSQLQKSVKDFSETYGLDYQKLKDLKRDELISLPEYIATERYILERGMEDLGDKASKLSEAMADGSVHSKRDLQMKVISFTEAYNGMRKLSESAAQNRSNAGTTLNLYRKANRQKIFEKFSDSKAGFKGILDEETQVRFIEKLMTAPPGELKRISSEIKDIHFKLRKGEISQETAMREYVSGKTMDKIYSNLGTYGYNNMLWGPTTWLKNYVGLHINRFVDKVEDLLVKFADEDAYYSLENFDLEQHRELIDLMHRIDGNVETNLKMVSSSKQLAGLVKDDGTMKSAKEIWSESLVLGRSMLAPGSEKYGVGYRSYTETDKAVVKSHMDIFGDNTMDNLANSYFNDSILQDAKSAASELGEKGLRAKIWNGAAAIHSFPLRALNATDDMFKSKILQEKLLLFGKQRVNKRLSKLSKEDFAEYSGDLEANYMRDLKREMSDIDNFDQAMNSAREITLTKRYSHGHSGEEFRLGLSSAGDGYRVDTLADKFMQNKLLRFFNPFMRISINMADYLTQYTPGAYIPKKFSDKIPLIGGKNIPGVGGKGYALNKQVADDLAAGGYRRSKAIAKIGVGLSVSSMAVYLVRNGHLVGAEPRDPAGRAMFRAAGLKADSFNFGSFSIPLNVLDPFGKYLKMAADIYNDGIKHANEGDDQYIDNVAPMLIDTAYAVANLAAPETLMSTISSILDFAGSKGEDKASLSRIMNTLGTGLSKAIPFSSFARFASKDQVGRTFEYDKDGVDEIATLSNSFYKNTFRGTTAVKNIFNEDVFYYNYPKDVFGDAMDQSWISENIPQFMTKLAKIKHKPREPIYLKLQELAMHLPTSFYKNKDLAIPRLSRTITVRGETVTLTNDQYNELIGYSNGVDPDGITFMTPMKEYLNDLVGQPWFTAFPASSQSKMIRGVIQRYHTAGRNMFKANNDQFRSDMMDKITTRMGLEQ